MCFLKRLIFSHLFVYDCSHEVTIVGLTLGSMRVLKGVWGEVPLEGLGGIGREEGGAF